MIPVSSALTMWTSVQRRFRRACRFLPPALARWACSAGEGNGKPLPAERRRDRRSVLRPQPFGNPVGDFCWRLIGNGEYRTDVDLAKHVAVGSISVGRAEHKVRVPDHWKVAQWNVQQGS